MQLEPDEFGQVSAQCSRWMPRSLEAARAIVVDGTPVADVAKAYEMTYQQADTIRTRFIAKVESIRVADFLKRNPPEVITPAALKPHKMAVTTLVNKGASTGQIVIFLRELGLQTSAKTVDQFIKAQKL